MNTIPTISFGDFPFSLSLASDAFHFDFYGLVFLAASLFVLFFGGFVFIRTRKTYQGLSFLAVCISFFVWLASTFMVYSVEDSSLVRLAIYLTYAGVSFIMPSLYWYVSVWLGKAKENRNNIILGFFLAAVLTLSIVKTDWIVYGASRYYWGYHSRLTLAGGAAYLIFFSAYLFFFYLTLFQGYAREKELIVKKQIALVTGSFIIANLSCSDFLPCYGIEVFPIGGLTLLIAFSVLGYTLIRYKLFDIETVVHKTLMWAVLSSLVFLPLGSALYYLRDLLINLHPLISSVFGVVLFVLFMMYAITIQPWIDHIFQRRKNDLKNELLRFNDNLVHLKGLSELSVYIVQTIRRVLYVSDVQLFLKTGKEKSLLRIDLSNPKNGKLDDKSDFIQWLEKQDELVLADLVGLDPHLQSIREEANRFFRELNIKVSIPLVLNGELIGLINLGQKANLKAFRSAEMMFLSELRRAATIALSNSLRLIEMQESLRKWNEELEAKVLERTEQLRETQKQLIQAEKLATIGVLAGGVAHEINNPLTAVLTNAQILKMSANADDLESIQLIEAGAKRCQEIIQKIMKYARKPLGPEKTEVVNLNDVIDNTIAFLRYQIEQENVEILVHKNGPVLPIQANGNELEQVLTNLILNAKDAVKDVNRPGKIEIKTLTQNGTTGFSVSDNGHGISEANLSKVFDPFFTTKDVGKGTGLGLAVTYGIVKKYGGQIDVSSKIGEGATFVVMFPGTAKQK